MDTDVEAGSSMKGFRRWTQAFQDAGSANSFDDLVGLDSGDVPLGEATMDDSPSDLFVQPDSFDIPVFDAEETPGSLAIDPDTPSFEIADEVFPEPSEPVQLEILDPQQLEPTTSIDRFARAQTSYGSHIFRSA